MSNVRSQYAGRGGQGALLFQAVDRSVLRRCAVGARVTDHLSEHGPLEPRENPDIRGRERRIVPMRCVARQNPAVDREPDPGTALDARHGISRWSTAGAGMCANLRKSSARRRMAATFRSGIRVVFAQPWRRLRTADGTGKNGARNE